MPNSACLLYYDLYALRVNKKDTIGGVGRKYITQNEANRTGIPLIDIEIKYRLRKVCYVPATSATFFSFFFFFLLRPLTKLMRQTKQAVCAINSLSFLDVYDTTRPKK
jgi:hypothetical protein